MTFMDYGSITKVFRALLKCYNKVTKTIASLWVSNYDLLSPDIEVSLVLSSSCNYLILVLMVISSA